ncbi:MAG: hypothetical protein AAF614_00835 [Chloroflexota bacterium]
MSLVKGVYWSTRDLDFPLAVAGNHHFILLVADASDFRYMGLPARNEKHGDKTTYFYTLGATRGEDGSKDGRLVTDFDNDADVKSVRELLDPDEHTSWWQPDFDLSAKLVSSDINMIRRAALRAVYYKQREEQNISSLPMYNVSDENCAAWVNTLLKSLSVSKQDRERLGDQFGVDWGELDEIDTNLFAKDWYVSYGGKTGWEKLNTSSARVDELAFGDFNGDKKTDIFR